VIGSGRRGQSGRPVEVAVQVSVSGHTVRRCLTLEAAIPPPTRSSRFPAQTMVWYLRAVGQLAPVEVAVQVSARRVHTGPPVFGIGRSSPHDSSRPPVQTAAVHHTGPEGLFRARGGGDPGISPPGHTARRVLARAPLNPPHTIILGFPSKTAV